MEALRHLMLQIAPWVGGFVVICGAILLALKARNRTLK